jgi:hypothetical protein
LVGPLPASSEGHVYLLTIIDRSTRWFEAVLLKNMEASTCVDAFISSWVAHFGVPGTVHGYENTVHLCPVVFYLHEPGHQAHAHHGLPSPEQRHG